MVNNKNNDGYVNTSLKISVKDLLINNMENKVCLKHCFVKT